MSRASGRAGTPRQELAEVDFPGTADEQRQTRGLEEQEGAGQASEGRGWERGIPGGKNHIASEPVTHGPVPVPATEWPYYSGLLAHGVPAEGHMHTRDPRLHGGQRGRAPEMPPPPEQTPVPVFIVEGRVSPVIRTASPRHITVPASTNAEPVRVCGHNPNRVEIRLLNESTTTDIRVAVSPTDLTLDPQNSVITGGALIPWPCNSYLSFPTQDELYAIGNTGSGTPLLSIIEVFEDRGHR